MLENIRIKVTLTLDLRRDWFGGSSDEEICHTIETTPDMVMEADWGEVKAVVVPEEER